MKKLVKTVNLLGTISPMTQDNAVPSIPTKQCSVCKDSKPASEFYEGEYRCKVCAREKTKRWNRANRERFNANKRKSAQKHKNSPRMIAVRENVARYRNKIRANVYAAYGGARCACCGETELTFLTIDHMDNDGAEHRKAIWGKTRNGSGSALYRWLRNSNYPPGFQVLCYNCNCGKQRNNGVCAHDRNEGVTTIPSGSTVEVSTSATGSASRPYPLRAMTWSGLHREMQQLRMSERAVA